MSDRSTISATQRHDPLHRSPKSALAVWPGWMRCGQRSWLGRYTAWPAEAGGPGLGKIRPSGRLDGGTLTGWFDDHHGRLAGPGRAVAGCHRLAGTDPQCRPATPPRSSSLWWDWTLTGSHHYAPDVVGPTSNKLRSLIGAWEPSWGAIWRGAGRSPEKSARSFVQIDSVSGHPQTPQGTRRA